MHTRRTRVSVFELDRKLSWGFGTLFGLSKARQQG
jgi:hypothetical protein